jgi:phosphoglycolate phosphatase-like HAD superfamily hydrolase
MLIIFDIDGTLTNTKKVDDSCFKSAFKETFGIDIENQNWEDLKNVTDWGITEEIILKERGQIPTANEYEALTANFVDKLNIEIDKDPTQFNAVKGANQFLYHLRQKNYKISIATGGWRLSAEMKLKASGLDVKGIPIANSNDHKTREDIIQHAILLSEVKHNEKFQRLVYFGDGVWDYTTSRKLGLGFIGLDIDQNDKLKKLGAEHVFKDYREVDLIEQVVQNM